MFYLLYLLLFAFLVGLVSYLFSAPISISKEMILESGFVEDLSMVGYFICFGITLVFSITKKLKDYSASLIMLLLGLRELDFHARFTTYNITKIKFYTSSEVSFIQKIIVVCLVLIILFVLVRFLVRNFPIYLRDLKNKSEYAIFAFPGILFLFLSKILDGITRKLRKAGFKIDEVLELKFEILEEVIELLIPYFFLLAIFSFFFKLFTLRKK